MLSHSFVEYWHSNVAVILDVENYFCKLKTLRFVHTDVDAVCCGRDFAKRRFSGVPNRASVYTRLATYPA